MYEIVPSDGPAESVAVTVVDSEYFKVFTAGVSENVRAALLIVTVAVAVSARSLNVCATAIETSHEPASTIDITAVDESMVHFVSVEEEYERTALSRRVVALGVIVPVGE